MKQVISFCVEQQNQSFTDSQIAQQSLIIAFIVVANIKDNIYSKSQKTRDILIYSLHVQCAFLNKLGPRLKNLIIFIKHHTHFSQILIEESFYYFSNICQQSSSRLPILMFLGFPVEPVLTCTRENKTPRRVIRESGLFIFNMLDTGVFYILT